MQSFIAACQIFGFNWFVEPLSDVVKHNLGLIDRIWLSETVSYPTLIDK